MLKYSLRVWILLTTFFLLWFLSTCEKNITDASGELMELPEESLQQIVNNFVVETGGVLGTVHRVDISHYQTWEGVTGDFDDNGERSLGVRDRFLIGSITKAFTATLLLQLYEEGYFDLDDTMYTYLPQRICVVLDSIPYGPEITIRQAMSHRSGIWNYTHSWSYIVEKYADPASCMRTEYLLRIVADEGHPYFAPGDNYKYSNTNYMLLGILIETVSGQNYTTLLNERIISVLGLSGTYLPVAVPLGTDDSLAHGYEEDFHNLLGGRKLDGLEFNCQSAGMRTAGGLVSNTSDLNNFFTALIQGTLFQNSSTLELMLDLNGNEDYGLGVIIEQTNDSGLRYGHSGAMVGFNSYAYYLPDQQIAISGCLMLDGTIEYISVMPLMEQLLDGLPDLGEQE